MRVLETIDFFSGLDRKLLDKVADAALLRTYPKGEVIIRQGDIGLGLYAILSGSVKVEREHQGTPSELAILGPHQFFAEISMIDSKPRSANVTTLEETECMLLTRDSFLKLVDVYPELALRLARVLAERLRTADERLAAQAAQNDGWRERAEVRPVETRPGDSFSKSRIQASMLDTFRNLYSMKAMVRFSVAVLGCPVEGAGADIVSQVRVGDAKAILLPADHSEMDIVASGHGAFTLHLFRPGASPVGYGPLAIYPTDRFQLRLAGASTGLWNAGRMVRPSAGGV